MDSNYSKGIYNSEAGKIASIKETGEFSTEDIERVNTAQTGKNIKSALQSINRMGGVENYINANTSMSGIQAGQLLSSLKAFANAYSDYMKKNGKNINPDDLFNKMLNGEFSDNELQGMFNTIQAKDTFTGSKKEMLDFAKFFLGTDKQALTNFFNKILEGARISGTLPQVLEALRQAGVEFEYDAKNNKITDIKNPMQAGMALAKFEAGAMSTSSRLNVGGVNFNISQDGATGEAHLNSASTATNVDTSYNIKQFGNGKIAEVLLKALGKEATPENIRQLAGTEEFISALKSGNWGKATAGKALYDFLKEKFPKLMKDVTPEEFNQALETTTAILGTGVTYGAELGMEKAYNHITGKRVATKEFSFEKDGKKFVYPKGKEFNINEIPEEFRELAEENSKTAPTHAGKVIKGVMDKVDDSLNKIGKSFRNVFTHQASDESVNSSINNSNNKPHSSSDDIGHNKTTHSKPPFENSTLSINDNAENVKSGEFDKLFDENKLVENNKNELINELKSKRPRKPERVAAKEKLLKYTKNFGSMSL